MLARSKILFILFFCFAMNAQLKAQHYQFSQLYAAPLYLNPALTGSNECYRLSMVYRDQWPSIPGTFVTSQFSFDHSLNWIHSGIGFVLFNDKAGSGNLKTTQGSLMYSYEAQLNKTTILRMGLSSGIVQHNMDFANLTFGDQIARAGSPTVELPPPAIKYMDFGTGFFLNSNRMWTGLAVNHLNSPNQSLTSGVSKLPMEIKLHAGYKFKVHFNEKGTKADASKNLTNNVYKVVMNYKSQDKFDQLDLGLYYTKDPLVFGLWYRGIPLFKAYSPGYANNDALVFLLGLSFDQLNIGYSYDLTISKLALNAGGSHEISCTLHFCNPKLPKKRRPIAVSCPKF